MTNVKKLAIGQINFWDIEQPNSDILQQLSEQVTLHPLTLEDLSDFSAQPKVEEFSGYILLILHLPIWQAAEKRNQSAEVDLLYAPNLIACIRYGAVTPIEEFWRMLETNQHFSDYLSQQPGNFFVFYELLRFIFKFLLRQLAHIQKKIEVAEAELFNFDLASLNDLRNIKMDVVDFVKIAEQNYHALVLLKEYKVFNSDQLTYLRRLQTEYRRILDQAQLFDQLVGSLETSQLNFLNLQFTRTVRTFTILAFITFPLALIVDVLGLGYRSNPLIDLPHSFWVIVAIVVTAALSMIVYFRNKKWL